MHRPGPEVAPPAVAPCRMSSNFKKGFSPVLDPRSPHARSPKPSGGNYKLGFPSDPPSRIRCECRTRSRPTRGRANPTEELLPLLRGPAVAHTRGRLLWTWTFSTRCRPFSHAHAPPLPHAPQGELGYVFGLPGPAVATLCCAHCLSSTAKWLNACSSARGLSGLGVFCPLSPRVHEFLNHVTFSFEVVRC
jgi:hypothetical protein